MEKSRTLQAIEGRFADSVIQIHCALGQDTAVLARRALLETARFLKEDPELDYNVLIDVTAVDYFKRRPRFEVVYHLLSLDHLSRVRLKVPVGEPQPEVDSLVPLWPAANWFEREVYDMFGIRFRGHPDLRRILMYEGFEGHPLRKDYPITRRQPRVGPQH